MRLGRTLPPAAAPLHWSDLWHGLRGMLAPDRARRWLQDSLRAHFGVGHVFLVSSGTAALTVTLKALRSRSRRSEVVLPAYTCYSVPAAVLEAGLQPALCDINPATFDFDHQRLAATLNDNTMCVIAHHLFGVPSDIDAVRALCHARGILVVEDAAQAMGVASKGRALGTIGDVGIFSLGRGKNITCGSGGVIVTNSDRLADDIARECGRLEAATPAEAVKDVAQIVLMMILVRPWLFWLPAALPWLRLGQTIFPKKIALKQLSGVKMGFLRTWTRRLSASNRVRSRTAAYFAERLGTRPAHERSNPYLRLPIVVESPAVRDRIHALSQERGLGLSVGYPTSIDGIPELRGRFAGQRFPVARTMAERLLTLPTHQWLSDEDKRAIVECVGAAARAHDPAERKAS